MKRIMALLEEIRKDVVEIKTAVSHLPKGRRSTVAGFNRAGKGCCISQKLRGGLRDPEIRAAVVRLRLQGLRFSDIYDYIVEHWPGQPEKHPSRSALHRFWWNCRDGRLIEYGIKPPELPEP